MKIFVTGASGFIGSAIVKELIGGGHTVVGLARSEASAKAIHDAGAEVLTGTLQDLDILKDGASQADGIIHTAFIHDFTQYAKANDAEKAAIAAMGEVLVGTSKPILITAGVLGLPKIDGIIAEDSIAQNSPRISESSAALLADKNINVSVVRLPPSVHDKGDKGFIPFIIQQARKNGVSGYPGDGQNRWPAVHRLDAATLFRFAIEKGASGALYNAIGDTGIEVKKIAALIGKNLSLPVTALAEDQAAKHFEWMARFISFDSPSTGIKTQQLLGWKPVHIGLLEDMEANYF